MAENLAKFNNAMSQFQSGQDGINNYLSKQGGELAGRASSAISSSIGISQEDKEAMDEAVGKVLKLLRLESRLRGNPLKGLARNRLRLVCPKQALK